MEQIVFIGFESTIGTNLALCVSNRLPQLIVEPSLPWVPPGTLQEQITEEWLSQRNIKLVILSADAPEEHAVEVCSLLNRLRLPQHVPILLLGTFEREKNELAVLDKLQNRNDAAYRSFLWPITAGKLCPNWLAYCAEQAIKSSPLREKLATEAGLLPLLWDWNNGIFLHMNVAFGLHRGHGIFNSARSERLVAFNAVNDIIASAVALKVYEEENLACVPSKHGVCVALPVPEADRLHPKFWERILKTVSLGKDEVARQVHAMNSCELGNVLQIPYPPELLLCAGAAYGDYYLRDRTPPRFEGNAVGHSAELARHCKLHDIWTDGHCPQRLLDKKTICVDGKTLRLIFEKPSEHDQRNRGAWFISMVPE